MRGFVLSTLLFSAGALAMDNSGLFKRQQFNPSTTDAQGNTCADAFGAGYVTCRDINAADPSSKRLCYNPTAGQTCCSKSYACPAGSFCLASGGCCPNGLSADTCAAQNRAGNNGTTTAPPTPVNTGSSLVSNGTTNGTLASASPQPSQQLTNGAGALSIQSAGALVGAIAACLALL